MSFWPWSKPFDKDDNKRQWAYLPIVKFFWPFLICQSCFADNTDASNRKSNQWHSSPFGWVKGALNRSRDVAFLAETISYWDVYLIFEIPNLFSILHTLFTGGRNKKKKRFSPMLATFALFIAWKIRHLSYGCLVMVNALKIPHTCKFLNGAQISTEKALYWSSPQPLKYANG